MIFFKKKIILHPKGNGKSERFLDMEVEIKLTLQKYLALGEGQTREETRLRTELPVKKPL